MHPLAFIGVFFALFSVRVIFVLISNLRSPLRDIPGPLLARFTRLWLFKELAHGHFEKTNIAIHKKYGPIVRIAPNEYSIDDVDAARMIYGHGSRFPKSDWYYAWRQPGPSKVTMFADQNIKRHAEDRKKFQSAYSMSSVLHYEPFVEDCGALLCQRFEELCESDLAIDLGHWLQCYAFDVIGEVTYSKRFGFLDAGGDVKNIIRTLDRRMMYSSLAGIYSEFHSITFRILNAFGGSMAAGQNYLIQFAEHYIAERKASLKAGSSGPSDMVTKFLQAHHENSAKFTSYNVMMGAQQNIAAGSDTTAASLSSIMYHLYRDPTALKRLRDEIDEKSAAGKISDPVKFHESKEEMPYLQAVIKEAIRIYPAVGLPLLRVVPEGGADMCGHSFPEGTVVGINAWVAHRNEDVFGPDASEFRPERWLTNDKEKLGLMERYNLTFGGGSRACAGRHVSYLEMSKIIPQLVRKFDFEFDLPQKEWTTRNYWFIKPTDFFARVKRRSS